MGPKSGLRPRRLPNLCRRPTQLGMWLTALLEPRVWLGVDRSGVGAAARCQRGRGWTVPWLPACCERLASYQPGGRADSQRNTSEITAPQQIQLAPAAVKTQTDAAS